LTCGDVVGLAVRASASRRYRCAFCAPAARKTKNLKRRVLLARPSDLFGNRFFRKIFRDRFCQLLAWRDWGFPDKACFNGFGMGAAPLHDGAFVLGEMGSTPRMPGRIYFPAGTPDLDDIREGAVDIPGSIMREAEEETD